MYKNVCLKVCSCNTFFLLTLWSWMSWSRSWQNRQEDERKTGPQTHVKLNMFYYFSVDFVVHFRLLNMFTHQGMAGQIYLISKTCLCICLRFRDRLCSVRAVVWVHWYDNTPLSLQNWWRGFYSSHYFTLYSLSWITCQQNTTETFRPYITCTRMIVSSLLTVCTS